MILDKRSYLSFSKANRQAHIPPPWAPFVVVHSAVIAVLRCPPRSPGALWAFNYCLRGFVAQRTRTPPPVPQRTAHPTGADHHCRRFLFCVFRGGGLPETGAAAGLTVKLTSTLKAPSEGSRLVKLALCRVKLMLLPTARRLACRWRTLGWSSCSVPLSRATLWLVTFTAVTTGPGRGDRQRLAVTPGSVCDRDHSSSECDGRQFLSVTDAAYDT